MIAAVAPLGEAGLRVALPPGVDRAEVFTALRGLEGAVDVVLGEVHAAVFFADPRALAEAEARIPDLVARAPVGAATAGREHRVRVVYDGPDLGRVAAWAGVEEAEVIRLHARRYVTIYLGFLPGFGYLGDVDPRIAAPRLPAPRARVPAGAVGIAADRTAVYPSASPGGWNLVGRVVDFTAFDADRGATLRPGDGVTFEVA